MQVKWLGAYGPVQKVAGMCSQQLGAQLAQTGAQLADRAECNQSTVSTAMGHFLQIAYQLEQCTV